MENSLKDFYDGKRALVTGADGFIGSHLTERLIDYGAHVFVYVHNENLKKIKNVKDKLKKILVGDLSGKESTEAIFKSNPQIIFHLAVDSYIPNSIQNPIRVNQINLGSTLNVLEASRLSIENDLKRLVFISSAVVYGSRNYAVSENEKFMPTTPYSASKVAGEAYCYSYFKTYNLPVAIARPFNIYGPRHSKDVISIFIAKALKNEEIEIDGGGLQTKDFIYIDDIIDGLLILGFNKKALGEAVNFGTGKEVSVKEIAEKIIRYSNSKSKMIISPERKGQDFRLYCNYSKAQELFNWQPKISIDEGLKKTIEWIKQNESFI